MTNVTKIEATRFASEGHLGVMATITYADGQQDTVPCVWTAQDLQQPPEQLCLLMMNLIINYLHGINDVTDYRQTGAVKP